MSTEDDDATEILPNGKKDTLVNRRAAIAEATQALESGRTAVSVLVICDVKGCTVGELVETSAGPVWRPRDKQFDGDRKPSDPFPATPDGGILIWRSNPIGPGLLSPAMETEGMAAFGACECGVFCVGLDALFAERLDALGNCRGGKLKASRPQRC